MEKETVIEDYGYEGEGVGKVNGKICFIPYVIKDEKVKFQIIKENTSFCLGKLVNVIIKSPLRKEPECPYFGICGGCSYQHIDYKDELNIKRKLFKRQLEKINYFGDIKVVSSKLIYGYRNKIKLFVSGDKIGLKLKNSDCVCDIDECIICEDKINYAIKIIKNFVKGNNLYDSIKNIVLRQENNNCLINFILRKDVKINYQGLYLLLGNDYGIFQTFNKKSKHIYGIKYLSKIEFGLNCQFSPLSFHQINNDVCKELYQTVLDNIDGEVINCYSGNGVLSGIIAKNKRVIGVEIGEAEHLEAQELRDRNKLKNLVNIKGDCAKILPNLDSEILIVDPPRSGLDKSMCSVINQKKFKKFIYISCNSATLVRDLMRISSYKIDKVYLFDMFARTSAYECLVILKNNL